uniref:Uncharacterized protein n=1 Tax=Psilocybe cubensis TaxID=181762 RepID=A0A8H8CP74_PSICU
MGYVIVEQNLLAVHGQASGKVTTPYSRNLFTSARKELHYAPFQFAVYEAYMDDVGNYTRAKNTRAARLFNRPTSHGPMIAVKTICVKPEEFAIKALHYEHLTANELAGVPFQAKRTSSCPLN